MKLVYPVVFTMMDRGLLVYVPNLDINTFGNNLLDAIEMARDAISLWCVCQEDNGVPLPTPSEISEVERKEGEIVTLVDIDTAKYRRMLDSTTSAMDIGA